MKWYIDPRDCDPGISPSLPLFEFSLEHRYRLKVTGNRILAVANIVIYDKERFP